MQTMAKRNQQDRFTIPIILAIGIPVLVSLSFLLKGKYGLFALFLYTTSANSFIPFPHEPAVISYGRISTPLTVSIICGLATCIGALIDIKVLGTIFTCERINEIKSENRYYRIAAYYFNQTPFWTIALASIM